MIKLKQFSYSKNNLGYVLFTGDKAIIIDGGAVDDMLQFLKEKDLELKAIINTHSHHDHISGNDQLESLSGISPVSMQEIWQKKEIKLGSDTINISPVPGHNADSVIYQFDDILITGDTLFNGTIGNCYTKDRELYFSSLQKILAFPAHFKVYAGHDLVTYAMGVAENLEPDNPKIREYLLAYNPDHVVSTLAQEKEVNPFVRFDNPKIKAFLEKKKLPCATDYQCWLSMMKFH